MKYDPNKIERKWQKYWEAEKFYNTKDKKDGNFMLLTEFPYPSGNLHIGHWYAFSLPDILARYLRMKGKNVFYPIGFDAFGLPAENAAIKNNIHPEAWTKKNIAYMTKQLKSMGATFDWSREIRTIDPDYYKWTQWMFLKFYEKGLTYRASTNVNWCPKDKTVLANEQVVNGKCERCDSEVVQKELSQWMFKITEFSDELIDEIKNLDWPETTVLAQKNWIGRSEGSRIKFSLCLSDQPESKHFVEIFTTRVDTLFGATAIIVSPELAQGWMNAGWSANEKISQYIKASLKKTELQRQEGVKSKTGVNTEVDAIHPLTEERIPVWIADYVLGHYGTGAVMFVPAHDQRDFDFAKKYNLTIKQVIKPEGIELGNINKAFEDAGILINSGEFSGLKSDDAKKRITEELINKGFGNHEKNYRLHDWILSRQRYWGVPIPMINCKECARLPARQGYVPVPEEELPVKLPLLKDFKPAEDGRSPLAKAEKWLKVKCPKCGSSAERETDTMDTFVDSSWYFMRYTDPKNKEIFADRGKMSDWLPVPMYIGGAEHNTMHLLYSRFFTKALNKLGYVDFKEPFLGRRNHGTILGPDNQKMSKSRGNVVDPDIEVKKYGADTVRMYLAFMGPYEQGGPWDSQGINGVSRFVQRIWKYFKKIELDDLKLKAIDDKKLEIKIHQAIKKIGDDIEHLRFNTCISELMKLFNELELVLSSGHKLQVTSHGLFLKLIAPFAPHLAEEIWINVLKNKTSIHLESWPNFDDDLLAEELIDLVIQINGKLRDTIKVKKGLSEDEVKRLVFAREAIQKHVKDKEVKKFIYIKDRLTNLVI